MEEDSNSGMQEKALISKIEGRFRAAEFITTVVEPGKYPQKLGEQKTTAPEIAFAGRSNVGKSSLINHLCGKKQLARVSQIPGKTQAINFFLIDKVLGLVDLPGYGFAKVGFNTKAKWGDLIEDYLEKRHSLKLILLLLDIRREPSAEDFAMVKWARFHKRKIAIVFTKADKVSKDEAQKAALLAIENLQLPNCSYVFYSVPKNQGKTELVSLLHRLLKSQGSFPWGC